MAVSRVTFSGRRRASGVTMGPIRTCDVAVATAASTTQGSDTASTGARYVVWS